MKKIKYILLLVILFSLTGCIKNNSMEDIKISTSVYPINYIVSTLYGNHSTINSIYPTDDDINNFKVTDTLLEQYSDSDLFIFNGLSDEKKYVKKMLKHNNLLKIIDVSSNMKYEYSMEELWLDPNNLLTIANNIKKGFDEYITSTYLTNEIDEKYYNLKIELTTLDGKLYSAAKNSNTNTLIISDDAFKFLEKYGFNIISLDPDTTTDKDISDAKTALLNGTSRSVFIKYKEDPQGSIKDVIDSTGANKRELYTMTNLTDIDTDKNDYISLMNQNIETLKLELYR